MQKQLMIITGIGATLMLAGCQKSQPSVTKTPPAEPTVVMEPTAEISPIVVPPGKDPKNSSYILEGQVVTLQNGKAEVPVAPGSASVVTVTMFGEPTNGDLNGDQVPDAAVTLLVTAGGSGMFYYQSATLKSEGMYTGTNSILLGDRISPQTTQVTDETIIANYSERAPGEPMTTQPSMAVSKYMQVKEGVLVEIENPNQIPQ